MDIRANPPVVSTPVVRSKSANPAENPGPTEVFQRQASNDVGLIKPLQLNDGVAGTLPRPMTDEEKTDFKTWFPNLDVDKSMVTAEATPRYNCISWTTGNTKSWDWPPSMYPKETPVGAFEKYYTSRGFSKVSAEDAATIGKDKELVAYWEDPNGPTHGSVQGPSHGDRWESKCGQAARITHERDELVSDVYGSIKGYWIKTGPSTVATQELDPAVLGQIKDKLQTRLAGADSELKSTFDGLYKQWQQDQKDPKIQMSSNPADYCSGEAFAALSKLGPQSLPFVIDKMVEGDHFSQYLAVAVSKPQGEDFRLMGVEPETGLSARRVDCSEQEKAQQVMEQWLKSSY